MLWVAGLRFLFIVGLLAYLWDISKRIGSASSDLVKKVGASAVLCWEDGPDIPIVVRYDYETKVLAKGEDIQLSGVIGMGRDARNTIQLSDPYISAYHARLTPEKKGWRVTDLASKNGTWRNEARISESVLLRTGDCLRIGETTFLFKG